MMKRRIKTFILDCTIIINRVYRKINKKLFFCVFLYLISPFLFMYALLGNDSEIAQVGNTKYYVGWINLPVTTNVYYEVGDEVFMGITGNTITDFYWDSNYIVATKCCYENDSIEGYYIIRISDSPDIKIVCQNISFVDKNKIAKTMDSLNINIDKMAHDNIFKSKIYRIFQKSRCILQHE